MVTYICTKCKYKSCVCAAVDGQPKPEICPCKERKSEWHIAGEKWK